MSTPPEDTATTWRELADQLRSEQIAELDGWERGGYGAAALLFTARVWAAENMTDTCEFTTVERRFGGTAIYVNGRQFDDGRCERWITLRVDETAKAQRRESARAGGAAGARGRRDRIAPGLAVTHAASA